MTERSPDNGTPASTAATYGAITDSIAPYNVKEGAFPRLQERTQTQLGFINSLLATLAIGLLAFAVNASTSTAELNRLGWRRVGSPHTASRLVWPGSANCATGTGPRNATTS